MSFLLWVWSRRKPVDKSKTIWPYLRSASTKGLRLSTFFEEKKGCLGPRHIELFRNRGGAGVVGGSTKLECSNLATVRLRENSLNVASAAVVAYIRQRDCPVRVLGPRRRFLKYLFLKLQSYHHLPNLRDKRQAFWSGANRLYRGSIFSARFRFDMCRGSDCW